jgi:hypothetical protein
VVAVQSTTTFPSLALARLLPSVLFSPFSSGRHGKFPFSAPTCHMYCVVVSVPLASECPVPGPRPAASRVQTHLPAPVTYCIPHAPSHSQPVPAFETVARTHPAPRTAETVPPLPSNVRTVERAPRPHGGTGARAHLPCLQMRVAEASAGLRLRHVNHGGAPAAANG